jgi:hypothetical protein
MTIKLTAVLCFASIALACAPKRIPGTDIDDNDETRAILGVMEAYRTAMEARDSDGVISLVADSFKDDQGSTTPEDDLDYARLREQLPQDLAKLEDVRLEMTVRKIDIDDEQNTARAVYTYSSSWRMPALSSKASSESEIKEMSFKRVGKTWKITSGI